MRQVFSALYYTYFFAASAVLFVGALAIFLLTLPFDRRGRLLHLYSCAWAMAEFRVNPGWRLKVEGRERAPSGAAVFVANHSSFFDIPVLFALFRPFKWVAKASLFRVPFVGWNMALNRHVALRRGDRESVARMMEHCERWLDRGVPVMIFPEGTRSLDATMKPFKDGAFRLAVKKGVPVVPMVIAGTEAIMPKHGLVLSPRADCRLRVLEPITPQECGGDVEALRERVRARMLEAREALKSAP